MLGLKGWGSPLRSLSLGSGVSEVAAEIGKVDVLEDVIFSKFIFRADVGQHEDL